VTATAGEYVGAAAPVTTGVSVAQVAAFAVMTAVLVAAPFFAYPVFLMKALCFALLLHTRDGVACQSFPLPQQVYAVGFYKPGTGGAIPDRSASAAWQSAKSPPRFQLW
jgi:hypothetical protein